MKLPSVPTIGHRHKVDHHIRSLACTKKHINQQWEGAITICNVAQRVQEAHELKVDWRANTIAAEILLPLKRMSLQYWVKGSFEHFLHIL